MNNKHNTLDIMIQDKQQKLYTAVKIGSPLIVNMKQKISEQAKIYTCIY